MPFFKKSVFSLSITISFPCWSFSVFWRVAQSVTLPTFLRALRLQPPTSDIRTVDLKGPFRLLLRLRLGPTILICPPVPFLGDLGSGLSPRALRIWFVPTDISQLRQIWRILYCSTQCRANCGPCRSFKKSLTVILRQACFPEGVEFGEQGFFSVSFKGEVENRKFIWVHQSEILDLESWGWSMEEWGMVVETDVPGVLLIPTWVNPWVIVERLAVRDANWLLGNSSLSPPLTHRLPSLPWSGAFWAGQLSKALNR